MDVVGAVHGFVNRLASLSTRPENTAKNGTERPATKTGSAGDDDLTDMSRARRPTGGRVDGAEGALSSAVGADHARRPAGTI